MALPAFVSASAKAAGTGAVTPALPAGMSADDIVILCATTITGGSISITADGSITPWTALTGSPMDAGGGQKLYVWWGRWASGSTGPTLTPGSDHICAGAAAFSGCIATESPIHVSAVGSEAAADTTLSFATGISTTVGNCLILLVSSILADLNTARHSAQANTNLSTVTERIDFCTNLGGGGGFELVEGGLVTAGAIGTWTATLATASAKDYISFALKPPVAVFTQSVDGTLTDSGTVAKQTSTFKSGGLTDSGTVVKQTSNALSGALTSAGAFLASLTKLKAIEGVLTSSGNLVNQISYLLDGALTSSGLLSKQSDKQNDGTLTSSGALVKQSNRFIAGTLTSLGNIIREIGTAFAGALSSS